MKDETSTGIQYAREHLANERTLLAWIRTCIGVMAFGFVVVKFSLFVRQMSLLLGQPVPDPGSGGYSSAIGLWLVASGAIILLLAYIKYYQTEKQLKTGAFKTSSTLILSLTVLMILMSILLLVYLVNI